MPEAPSPYVFHGAKSYIDYDRHHGSRWQWLVSVRTADVLTNALAVFLTLAMRSVFNIVNRLWKIYGPHGHPMNGSALDNSGSSSAPNSSTVTPSALPQGSTPLSAASTDAGDGNFGSSDGPSGARATSATSPESPTVPLIDSAGTTTGPVAMGSGSQGSDAISATSSAGHGTADRSQPGHSAYAGRPTHEIDVAQSDEPHADSPETSVWLYLKRIWKDLQGLRSVRLGDGDSTQQYNLHVLWADLQRFPGDLHTNLTTKEAKDIGWSLVIILIMLVLYSATIALGVASSTIIISDSTALSKHPGCGFFLSSTVLNDSDLTFQDEWRKYLYDFEVECGQYAARCYNATSEPDGCNFFYQRSFEYSVHHNDTCPFHSDSGYLCHGGPSSAFTLRTGKIEAKALGINSPYQYSFERSTTCSPLLMDNRFVRRYVQDGPKGFKFPGFRYYYGNRTGDLSCTSDHANCTFEIRGTSLEQVTFDNAGYTVRLETYDPVLTKNWKPIFDVDATAGERATLMLINNIGVFYPHKREDPIFYADTLLRNESKYYSGRNYAGVLGCMDRTMFCPPHGVECVPDLNVLKTNHTTLHEEAVYYMLAAGLVFSNTGDSIQYRRAQALDAQTRVAASSSLGLATEQWKVEARKLFETSLARTQIMLRNIARGSPMDTPFPDQYNSLPSDMQRVCNMYKFHSVGWRNISVARLLGITFGAIVVLIAGITTETKELWSERKIKGFPQSILGKALGTVFSWVAAWAVEAAEALRAFGRRKANAAGNWRRVRQ